MKVAHICVVTPGRCGLYETARELVSGLRKLDIDSRMVDIPKSNKIYPKGYPEKEDRGALMADMDWACGADIIVSHSGYDGTPVEKTSQPIIHVAHGRPRSGFVTEMKGSTPIYSYQYQKNFDSRWKGVVTLWPEHVPYLEVMFPDKPVHYVQSCVDLDYWSMGPRDYDFHGNRGEINVVCSDPKRDDNDAFLPMNVFAQWARTVTGAKFHLFGAPSDMRGYDPVLKRIRKDGNLGVMHRWSKKLRDAYRAADLLITSSGINTRSVREAMACGCPVLQINSMDDVSLIDTAMTQERDFVRWDAQDKFSPSITAKQFKRVLEC